MVEAAVARPGTVMPDPDVAEYCDHVDAQAVVTRRAGIEACRQVGENARPVLQLAEELGRVSRTVLERRDHSMARRSAVLSDH